MKKIMVISNILMIFVLGFFFISCHQGEEKTSSPPPTPTFTPLSINLSYAGWGSLDLHKSLNDGFAVYGCSSVKLKDVKVASVNYEGEPDLEFFGAVGGMGEIEITGNSYISGDLVYPPGGTYTVSNETEIKGLKYAWGVSECPWWSYENASRWDLKSSYPEVLTVSSKVTLEAGGYRFKLLDVESGGELYGRGVSIMAERVVVNGGKLDIEEGMMIAKDVEISSGEVRGRIFTESFSGTEATIIGKIVGEAVSVGNSQIYYDSDIVCKGEECRIPYAFEISRGVLSKRYIKVNTDSLILSQEIKATYKKYSYNIYPYTFMFIESEEGLEYLLRQAQLMKKLGYCFVPVYEYIFPYLWEKGIYSYHHLYPCQECNFTTWVATKKHQQLNIFYLERLLEGVNRLGQKSNWILPFSLAGIATEKSKDMFSLPVTYQRLLTEEVDFNGKRWVNYIGFLKKNGIFIYKGNSKLQQMWKEYAHWVTENCEPHWISTFAWGGVKKSVVNVSDKNYGEKLYMKWRERILSERLTHFCSTYNDVIHLHEDTEGNEVQIVLEDVFAPIVCLSIWGDKKVPENESITDIFSLLPTLFSYVEIAKLEGDIALVENSTMDFPNGGVLTMSK